MKQRLADYVADFLVAHGVKDVFSVVGGGAMHLNDALGHNNGLHVTYNHHGRSRSLSRLLRFTTLRLSLRVLPEAARTSLLSTVTEAAPVRLLQGSVIMSVSR